MSNDVTIHVKSKDDTDFQAVNVRADREFKKGGERASKSFGSSFKRWFSGDAGKTFEDGGKFGASVFGSGFLGALKTPMLGPAITGVVGGAVAVAMPAAGAVAASGLIAGFGAGLAGLGLMTAAKSKDVQDVWSRTLGDMGKDMSLLSRPFEGTLVDIAGIFDRTVNAFEPALGAAFKKMAPTVGRFADVVGRGLEQLVPAINPITDAFDRVLDSLGPALQGAIGDISAGLVDLAGSVKRNSDGLADLVTGIGDLSRDGLHLVGTLNDINGEISDLTGGMSAVDLVFGGLSGGLAGLDGALGLVKGGLSAVNGLADVGAGKVQTMGVGFGDAAKQIYLANIGLTTAGKATSEASAAAAGASPAVQALVESYKAEDAALQSLVLSMGRMANQALGLSGAQIGFQAAVDDATASLKDNGKTLDINTEKGRANKTALNAVASAANQQTESMLKSGKSMTSAASNAEGSRAKFITLARQMGLSKAEAQRLARQLIEIPNVSRQAKLTANKKDLESKLGAAKRELGSKDLTRERRARLNADISALKRQIAAAQAAINGLHGKTVTIRTVRVGGVTQDQGVGRGGRTVTEGHASGGLASRGWSWVGEAGPELMWMPGNGTKILTAGASRRAFSQLAGTGISELGDATVHRLGSMENPLAAMMAKWKATAARHRQQRLRTDLAEYRAAKARQAGWSREDQMHPSADMLSDVSTIRSWERRAPSLPHLPGTNRNSATSGFTFQLPPAGNALERMFLDWLRQAIRNSGGNVQSALGS